MDRVGSRHAWCAAAVLAGCGSNALPMLADAGKTAPIALTLSVSIAPLALDGLVITTGTLELERLGIFGDEIVDQRTEVPRVDFSLGPGTQSFVFDDASYGIYSRVHTEIDHVLVQGTWRGMSLYIDTQGVERVVDLRGADQELSTTQAAHFNLAVDGTTWLDAATLDGAANGAGAVEVDAMSNPSVVETIVTNVTASFSLQP